MKTPLIILGAVGNCLDIAEATLALDDGRYELLGFLDDDPKKQGTKPLGLPVLGTLAAIPQHPSVQFVSGIGNARMFQRKADIIGRTGLPAERFATIVHPRAVVSASARIGPGSVILANATLCAQARIGAHVLVLPNCVIGHDTEIGDYSILTAGVVLSGGVHVGASSYIGSGARVREGLSLGEGSLLGMGAVLVKDQPSGTVYVGTPARELRRVR